MIVIGITGGSGSGKGYVCSLFAERGISSVNADEVYHRVSAPGMPCLAELVRVFGGGILQRDGSLDRPALSAIVFAPDASDKLARLNSITHKYVIAECERWLAERERAGDSAAIIDAPQLFESGLDRRCDIVVSVSADREQRIERIVQRDGIARKRAEARIAAQHDERFFAQHSDFVIDSGDGADVAAQVDRVIERITELLHGKAMKGSRPESGGAEYIACANAEKSAAVADGGDAPRKSVRARHVIIAALVLIALIAIVNLAVKMIGFYGRVTHPVLYSEQITRYADEYSVPEEIICAVINTESSFASDAVSPAGAIGLMQITKETFWWLMSKTGEELPVEELYDPDTNIRYGTLFLSLLYDEFGSWDIAFAAYNAGRTRVNGWLEDETVTQDGRLVNIPIEETAEYVVKVNKNIEKYRELLEENG